MNHRESVLQLAALAVATTPFTNQPRQHETSTQSAPSYIRHDLKRQIQRARARHTPSTCPREEMCVCVCVCVWTRPLFLVIQCFWKRLPQLLSLFSSPSFFVVVVVVVAKAVNYMCVCACVSKEKGEKNAINVSREIIRQEIQRITCAKRKKKQEPKISQWHLLFLFFSCSLATVGREKKKQEISAILVRPNNNNKSKNKKWKMKQENQRLVTKERERRGRNITATASAEAAVVIFLSLFTQS